MEKMIELKNEPHTQVGNVEPLNGLRIYKDGPFTVAVQIRSIGPVTASRRGKDHPSYSHASLTLAELDSLISELNEQRAAIAELSTLSSPRAIDASIRASRLVNKS